jgi:hypothetical protein
MKNKITLGNDDISNIIKIYQEETIGVEALAGRFKVGKLKIKDILNQHNIPIKKKGAQIINGDSSEIEASRVFRYTVTDDSKKLIAVCKSTNRGFDDINNVSGALTSHILSTYGDVPIPSNTYQRKKYEKEYGKKWFEEYFDIKEVDKPIVKPCPYCDWCTSDLVNKSGQFMVHLMNEHSLTLNEYIKTHPEDSTYFKQNYNNESRIKELSSPTKHVICAVCGDRLKSLTQSHLKKHGLTPLEYKLKFPNSNLLSDELYAKFSEQFRKANVDMKPTWSSKGELEVLNYIQSLGFEVEKHRNRRLLDGKEIDLVLPELSLAIEYNGLYYHTEKMGKGFNYHLDKTKACNSIGYRLIHIFEDEWINSTELVKRKLKHILGVSDGIRIGGRLCKINEIDNKTKSEFLNNFHIQGDDKSDIKLGAYYGDKLIGVMTFNSKRVMTIDLEENTFELSRFATNYDYVVSGLASKFLNHFKKHFTPKKIVSFADRRWTLDAYDNLYTKLGFSLVNITKPNYWYYNSKVVKYKRLHKFGFGKSSLKKKYPELDFSKTERELMLELGYDRIWDCGLFKYELSCEKFRTN